MSSQGTVDKTTVVSREKYCSIDTKTDGSLKEYYNSTWKIYLVVIALALTTFCTSLDSTILATAIPQITDRFNSLDDVEWYGAAYLLANCSVQLIYGKLYHLHSVKWVYLVALFLFQLGSFVCAIAPSSVVLITGRAVAGLGAAGILSGSILMIRQLVPLHQRPGYMAALASMTGIAWIIGPIIGGAFTDSVSWRWCFYINLPFGLITCILLLIFYQPLQLLPNSQRVSLRDSVRFLDIEGTALFLPAIVSLLLALQWGGTKFPWGSVQIIVLLIIFSITSVGFVFVQIWKQELATVPPRVMTSRNVWAGFVFTFCFGAAVVVAMYYIPLWLQVIKNDSSESSGIMTLSLVIAMVVTSLLTAILITVIGYYTPFMILASILMSVGGGLLSTLDTNASSKKYIAFQIIFGSGVGCGIQQSMVAIQAAVNGSGSRNSSSSSSSGSNGSAVSMGTAIMTFAQTLGGAIFIAVAQNVFENKLSNGIVAAKVPGLDSQAILKIGATELRNTVESQYWDAVSHAYNAAIDDTFRVATIVAAVSILGALGMEWISIKR
ncbi:MFS transporter [Talaromyces proteolyticus]|uniref:MFS transporter n=1 Tax=Talaromyces proteolyticus TaxID=1131652 RepID=A0AAD4PW12_9EURO|nr:MFS transporter [Talaromyces proteolyticus]KAH8692008.1 MFS transporter [Talaromyces proteolyticus]